MDMNDSCTNRVPCDKVLEGITLCLFNISCQKLLLKNWPYLCLN